jgi:hypothetical protein
MGAVALRGGIAEVTANFVNVPMKKNVAEVFILPFPGDFALEADAFLKTVNVLCVAPQQLPLGVKCFEKMMRRRRLRVVDKDFEFGYKCIEDRSRSGISEERGIEQVTPFQDGVWILRSDNVV